MDLYSLPRILERVLQKFSSNKDSDNIGELFVELSVLLTPRVVQAALHLLDYQLITIYHNPLRTREIAEINEGSSKLIRLYPRLNYCTCEYFQNRVLGNEGTLSAASNPYTCEHVLALRLATLLESDKLRFEELPTTKLKSLQSLLMPDEDVNSD